MSSEELLQEYRDNVSTLSYLNKGHLDRIRRKGKMLIRNVHGDRSDYLSILN